MSTLFSCRDVIFTARSSLYWTICGTDWVLPAGYKVLLLKFAKCWIMEADGSSVVDNRVGVTFGVELYIPWDAPEAVVDILSADAVPLRNVPDVFGMVGRRNSATESRVLPGRDARSVRVLVPDCRSVDQNFHDVTVVDMRDLPESHVSMLELSKLIHKWPPAVINHMMWRQRELEEMLRAARVKYRQKHPSPCTFCGTLIRCDMYRHMEWDCVLFCLCLWFCQSNGDRPTLHAGLCHVRWSVQMLYVPRLDPSDARSVAGGQFGSWSHLYESLLDSRCRTHWPRRGRWCSIAALRCCRG